ncbi:MAG: hypothetical protein K8J31_01625 [Anaerolineae bacterium]|nr:hypothetical protein [Anaerolineae bacterium]
MDTPRRMLVLGLVLCLGLGMLAALLYTRTATDGPTIPADGEQGGSSPWFVIMVAMLTATLVPILAYASRRGGSSPPPARPKHKRKHRVVQRADGDSCEVVDDDP